MALRSGARVALGSASALLIGAAGRCARQTDVAALQNPGRAAAAQIAQLLSQGGKAVSAQAFRESSSIPYSRGFASAAATRQALAYSPGRIWTAIGGTTNHASANAGKKAAAAGGASSNAAAAFVRGKATAVTAEAASSGGTAAAAGAAAASSAGRTAISPLVAGVSDSGRMQVAAWLGLSCGWVFALVVLGGVTRLTRSGLSMTEWKFTGERPPITLEDWEADFDKYRASPEFRQVHSKMTLDEFKFIFWMEYGHRMWARALGLLFIGPASYFAARGYINSALSKRLGLLFLMGGTQGLVGWWMVRSGLKDPKDTDNPHAVPRVSPYRLAGHLASAFAIYTTLVWTTLNMAYPTPLLASAADSRVLSAAKKLRGMVHPLAALVGITALSGAFVAGNDAGRAYNTFPTMNGQWIPDDYFEVQHGWLRNCFENTAAVQLHHRCLALSTATSVLGLWAYGSRLPLPRAASTCLNLLLAGTALQVTLGISTLLTYVPVSLGSAHQAGALGLFTVVLSLMHTLRAPIARPPGAARAVAFPLAVAAVLGVGAAVTQQQ